MYNIRASSGMSGTVPRRSQHLTRFYVTYSNPWAGRNKYIVIRNGQHGNDISKHKSNIHQWMIVLKRNFSKHILPTSGIMSTTQGNDHATREPIWCTQTHSFMPNVGRLLWQKLASTIILWWQKWFGSDQTHLKRQCLHTMPFNDLALTNGIIVLLCFPPLGETYCFCLVRLSVWLSVRLSHFVSAQ